MQDNRLAVLEPDLQTVSDQPGRAGNGHANLKFHENRLVFVASGDNVQKTSARVKCLSNISRQSVSQEAEQVEERGFTRSVGADQNYKTRDIRKVNVLQRLEIANRNGFQCHGGVPFTDLSASNDSMSHNIGQVIRTGQVI